MPEIKPTISKVPSEYVTEGFLNTCHILQSIMSLHSLVFLLLMINYSRKSLLQIIIAFYEAAYCTESIVQR